MTSRPYPDSRHVLTTEERKVVQKATRVLALEFLSAQRQTLASRVRRREEQGAARGETISVGNAELAGQYAEAEALLAAIGQECERELLVDVLSRRRALADEKMRRLGSKGARSSAGNSEYWRARAEWLMLGELTTEWMAFVRGKGD